MDALISKVKGLIPAGAVSSVLLVSWLASPVAILGIGTGYDYGGPACTSASISAGNPFLSPAGDPVTLTGSSTTCTHPEYQFFIQPSGGAVVGQGWQPWNGTATGTFIWNTTGLAPGTYTVGVWARNSGSPTTYEAYAAVTYILSGTCFIASMTDSTQGLSNPGVAVTFTASGVGELNCPAGASYRFWALVPGRSYWQVIQDWSSTNTFNWTAAQTGGSPQGTYQVGVWIRMTGSTNTYDAYTIITHVLGVFCGEAIIAAAPASPSTATVTFTAFSNHCSFGTQYQFWELPPGGSWTVLQPFSTSNMATFSASTATTGQWRFGVWVKDPNSNNMYDSFAIITYYVGT